MCVICDDGSTQPSTWNWLPSRPSCRRDYSASQLRPNASLLTAMPWLPAATSNWEFLDHTKVLRLSHWSHSYSPVEPCWNCAGLAKFGPFGHFVGWLSVLSGKAHIAACFGPPQVTSLGCTGGSGSSTNSEWSLVGAGFFAASSATDFCSSGLDPCVCSKLAQCLSLTALKFASVSFDSLTASAVAMIKYSDR